MKNAIDPLLLVPNLSIEIVQDESIAYMGQIEPKKDGAHNRDITFPSATTCAPVAAPTSYLMKLNIPLTWRYYQRSWLAGKIDFEAEILPALHVLEVCHPKYGTFDIRSPLVKNDYFEYIVNILEDARIEYHLCADAPLFARGLRFLLTMTQPKLPIGKITKKAAQATIDEMLADFRLLARYGTIPATMEPEFASLCLGVSLSTRRGSPQNCCDGATAIYYYLLSRIAQDSKQAARDVQKAIGGELAEEPVTSEMIECAVSTKGTSAFPSPTAQALVQAKRSVGLGDTHVVVSDEENPFYASVLSAHAPEIYEVRRAFSKLFDGFKRYAARDGELRIPRQQQAYLSSLLGEETADYRRRRRIIPDVQFVLAGDVSQSTEDFVTQYATAKAIVLASLEKQEGIATCALDFSDDAAWIKAPGETLSGNRLRPYSLGGTNLLAAMKLVERDVRWSAAQRFLFIVTDGDFLHDETPFAILRSLERDADVHIALIHSSPQGGDGFLESVVQRGSISFPLYQTGVAGLPALVHLLSSVWMRGGRV